MPQVFYQVYIIHGSTNWHTVPLVNMLLPGKTETIYRTAFSALFQLLKDRDASFCPNVDFEKVVIIVLSELLPDIKVICCRFHSGQALYRNICRLGLSQNYQDSQSETGAWLRPFFALPYLDPSEVEDSFCFDMMPDVPEDPKCQEFAEYVFQTFVSPESVFPPKLWTQKPSQEIRTTNAAEAFHRHLNENFASKHPNIFTFTEAIKREQAMTTVKLKKKPG
ncbi:hypothetical protein ElyMa_004959900 [Elysia marginata]|uniref:MULE transposase domain-containing protein n=1 Tax=Elysia marginata TaxID=1093978 RepID=A0AAV4J530_9GAST|nr:hypothetical protein ElyMa_004959900 [Elysia marginata]